MYFHVMKFKIYIILLLVCFQEMKAQEKLPFQIFDKNGRESSYKQMLKASEKADVVLFGEFHNNSIVHWLQLEFTKD